MSETIPPQDINRKQQTSAAPVVILLARSAIAAVPIAQMENLAQLLTSQGAVASVRVAFSEQGQPALREELIGVVNDGAASIVILPVMLPAEPSYQIWLAKAISGWEREDGCAWPEIRIAPLLSELPGMANLLGDAVNRAIGDGPIRKVPAKAREGSIVPAQERRVLVCHGAPCMAAGAALTWGHLRNLQDQLSLRTAGVGMMSAKSGCLGPCNLAPVVQVCPENAYYGGVDEQGIDAIIRDHILHGAFAEDYFYPADGRKHVLRANASISPFTAREDK